MFKQVSQILLSQILVSAAFGRDQSSASQVANQGCTETQTDNTIRK